jgi:hypothetical protein
MKAAQNVVGLDEVCYVVDTLLLQLLYFKSLNFAIPLNPFLDILPISRKDVSTITPCRTRRSLSALQHQSRLGITVQ